MLPLCLNDFVIIFLVIFLAVPSCAQSDWNQEARDYVVEIHNDRRRAEGGCPMNKLVYDMELERQARVWAERCLFEHEMKEGRGENLAWNSNEEPEKELIKTALDRWFNEKNQYSYGQYSCAASCHYTQMVWAQTNRVGCYSIRCLAGAIRNAWYLVCFYTPIGNWNGEKPYPKGCSSPCLEGQTVENGLCVGESKNVTEQGPGNDETCDDDVGGCEQWARSNQCEINPGYMKVHCRKSCKLCTPDTCEDLHSSCSDWAQRGECQINPGYMKVHCRKSCQLCTPDTCEDLHSSCIDWAQRGECQNNPTYMENNCKKSCNTC